MSALRRVFSSSPSSGMLYVMESIDLRDRTIERLCAVLDALLEEIHDPGANHDVIARCLDALEAADRSPVSYWRGLRQSMAADQSTK